MSCKPKAKSLRAANGVELMNRFAKQNGTIHAADGLESVGTRAQDQFGSGQLTAPTISTPPVMNKDAARGMPTGGFSMAVPTGLQLRDGGDLRTGHGGSVPGTGEGDKIPAKYEPGEFVVSNDMLDAQPELRGHLRGLREGVLAAKGMTPEQADAKAVSGGGLRAVNAFGDFYDDMGEPLGQHAAGPAQKAPEQTRNFDAGMGQRARDAATQRSAARAQIASGATINANSPAARPTGVLSSVKSWGQAAKGYAGSAANAAKAVGPAAAAGGAGYAAASFAQDTGNPANGARGGYELPAAANQIPTGGYSPAPAAQPYNYFTDNDTGRNLKNLAGAVSILPGVSPLASGVRTGSNAARALGAAETFGAATAGGARAGMDTSVAAPTQAVPAEPNSYVDVNRRANARGLRIGDPSSSDLNDIHSNAMIENRNPGGKVTKIGNSYSGGNVSGEVSFQGADGNALRGRPGGGYMSSSAGDGEARLSEARASLRNPDGSSWSANDNAIMAANIRDGVDKYRGTSRDTQGAGVDKYANMPIKTAAAMRVADTQANTTLRSTEMNNETSLMGNKMTNAFNLGKFRVEQSNKDREYAQTQDQQQFKQRQEYDKDLTSKLEAFHVKKDKDTGNSIVDKDAVAASKAAVTSHIAGLIRAAQARGDTATVAELQRKGPSAMGEDGLQRLLTQLEVKRRTAGAHSSFNPFGGEYIESSNPADYDITGIEPGVLQDQYILRGGGRVPTRSIDFSGGGNAVLPNAMGDTRTTRFDSVKNLRNYQ